jgi:carotenoid cleavage dioxygenase-like enzyme
MTTEDLAAAVWTRVATCEPRERDQEVIALPSGAQLPQGLPAGTYYVNGLASCQISGPDRQRLVHPFEAHGFCKSFRWDGHAAQVRLTAKYVRTPVRVWEQRFQRPLWRGAMSSVADPRTLLGRFQNALAPTARPTANLAVRAWQKDVLVTADNCPFYRLDGDTLETQGKETMVQDALAGYQMLAHTRVDDEGRLVAVALVYEPAAQATILTCFEFDSTSGALLSKRVHRQSPAVVVHDWTLTPHYYVIPSAEAVFDLGKLPDLLTGKSTATEIFAIDPDSAGTLLLIPRNPERDNLTTLQATLDDGRHGVVFHMGPCHEEVHPETGRPTAVVTHPFVFDRYQFGGEMGFLNLDQRFDPTSWANSNGGPKLEQWTIPIPVSVKTEDDTDPAPVDDSTPVVTTPMASRRLNSVVSDMPTFRPDRDGGEGPCRFVYCLAGIRPMASWFPFNAIVRHDLETGETQIWPPEAAAAEKGDLADWDGGECVRSEPLFVPKEGAQEEGEGFLLSTTHDTRQETTLLEIYNAQRVGEGPVLSVDLGELWGWNVHSTFVPDTKS